MKKLVTVFGVLALMGVMVLSVFAAGERTEDEEIVIGKVPITLVAEFHQSLIKHEIEYAKEKYGATVKVIDGEFKTDVAMNAVEDFIAQGVDGILLHTYDGAVLDEAIEAAHEEGIPISTFYNEPVTKGNPHVQINEAETSFQMGVIAATKWKESYPDKPIYVGLIAYLNIPHAVKMRSEPFTKGIMSVDPNAVVASRLDGGGSTEQSLAAAQDMLQAHPEVNIVYGSNADMALAALSAFESAGRGKAVNGKPLTEIFCGTDATEAELIKLFDPNSSFKVTQGLQPRANAEAEIDTVMKMINGELAMDVWIEVPTLNKLFSYWDNTIDEGTEFLQYQYFLDVDLKEELGM